MGWAGSWTCSYGVGKCNYQGIFFFGVLMAAKQFHDIYKGGTSKIIHPVLKPLVYPWFFKEEKRFIGGEFASLSDRGGVVSVGGRVYWWKFIQVWLLGGVSPSLNIETWPFVHYHAQQQKKDCHRTTRICGESSNLLHL